MSFNVHSELKFACSAASAWLSSYTAVTFDGVEALSKPFECSITFQKKPEASFPTYAQLEEMLDEECSFDIGSGAADLRKHHGIVRSVEVLSTTAAGAGGLRIVVVPLLWRLSLTKRTRQFNNKTTREIVETVLKDNGLAPAQDYSWANDISSSTREYTMQYDETDLAFVSRLLEWEGIFYYFEQGEQRSKMVITDKNAGCELPDLPDSLTYHAIGSTNLVDVVHSFEVRRTLAPHKVRLYDYNYRLSGASATISQASNVASHGRNSTTGVGFELYGENLKSTADATRIATRRAQQITTQNSYSEGASQVRGLGPGHTFTLASHPIAALNAAYLVTEVRHTMRSDGPEATAGYRNTFKVVPATQQFRPELATPRPHIHGFVQAKIAGTETGNDAPLDSMGRYQLTFMIDSSETMSRWTRVAQATASTMASPTEYGMHWPLHTGAEVLVAFAQGDPDRPVIVGAVGTATNPSTVTSVHPTRAIFRTKAQVEIHLDDDA